MNNLKDILKASRHQIKCMSDKGRERIKVILEKEIKRISEAHKTKGKQK